MTRPVDQLLSIEIVTQLVDDRAPKSRHVWTHQEQVISQGLGGLAIEAFGPIVAAIDPRQRLEQVSRRPNLQLVRR